MLDLPQCSSHGAARLLRDAKGCAPMKDRGSTPTGDDRWLTRLDPAGVFTARDRVALLRAAAATHDFKAQEVLLERGDRIRFAYLVIEGLVARRKETALGKHQITAIFVPGDLIDGDIALQSATDHDLVALSEGRIAPIPEPSLSELEADSGLARAIQRSRVYEAAIAREWVVNIGARGAGPRVAHLLCELVWRLQHAGLAEDHACILPIRQQDIADATGISAVHVNRVLQRLRRTGLIRLAGERLDILEPERLDKYAEFEPDYLEAAAGLRTPLAPGAASR